jgi:hypothetical protein
MGGAGGCVSWFPAWAGDGAAEAVAHRAAGCDLRRVEVGGEGGFHALAPAAAAWPALGDGLRAAQQRLSRLPVAEILDALAAVCARWADRDFPPRARACAGVVAATGFSPEAVQRSFDVELANYQPDALRALLRRELGDPEVLDGFRPDPALGGHTRAIGPALTLVVCSGNVPALPALSLVRALLVKSSVLVKVASGEPAFAAHFARSLAGIHPVLGDAVAVTYWARGDTAALRGAVRQADAVIAYGSPEACAAIRAELAPGQRYVEHGHKVSAGLLTQGYLRAVGLAEAARRVAADVSVFNQHACISPQVYLVQDGKPGAREVAGALAAALAGYAAGCPLGALPAADAAALQLNRARAAWAAAGDSGAGLWHAPGLDWTVTLDPELAGTQGAGNRVISVVPVRDSGHAVAILRPIGHLLQNIGLGAVGPEFWATAEQLGQLGASRISEPGAMSRPTVIWRHDGAACLAALVRWCDIEDHAEAARAAHPHPALRTESRADA